MAIVSGKARTAGLGVSEWIRRTILADSTLVSVVTLPLDEILLAEIFMLQTLILNLSPAAGLPVSTVQHIMAQAQASKRKQAREALAGT